MRRPAGPLLRQIGADRVEHVHAGPDPGLREIPPGTAAGVDRVHGPVRHRLRRIEREELGNAPLGQSRVELVGPEEQAVRRHRPVHGTGRAQPRRVQVLPCRVVLGDEIETRLRRLVDPMVEDHDRLRHVVEQGLEPRVEQGQPVLHAHVAPALGDGLEERIVRSGDAEQLPIGGAETGDRLGVEEDLADRLDGEGIEGARRPL